MGGNLYKGGGLGGWIQDSIFLKPNLFFKLQERQNAEGRKSTQQGPEVNSTSTAIPEDHEKQSSPNQKSTGCKDGKCVDGGWGQLNSLPQKELVKRPHQQLTQSCKLLRATGEKIKSFENWNVVLGSGEQGAWEGSRAYHMSSPLRGHRMLNSNLDNV